MVQTAVGGHHRVASEAREQRVTVVYRNCTDCCLPSKVRTTRYRSTLDVVIHFRSLKKLCSAANGCTYVRLHGKKASCCVIAANTTLRYYSRYMATTQAGAS